MASGTVAARPQAIAFLTLATRYMPDMAQREQDTREGIPTSSATNWRTRFGQVDQVTETLRAEIARLQQEVSDRGCATARGAGYVRAAGALGVVVGGALAALLLIALRNVYPAPALARLARPRLPPEDLLRVLRALADATRLEMLR